MKFIIYCIVLCVHLCLEGETKSNKTNLRIMGGRNATENEFIYVAKLRVQSVEMRRQINKFICSCSILTSEWTLTAAHCIQALGFYSHLKPVIQYKLSKDVAYSDVLATFTPPSFIKSKQRYGQHNRIKIQNDIGLFQTQPVICAEYGKLSSVDYTTLNGQEVSLVGYGITQREKVLPRLPRIAQVTEAIVKQCPKHLAYPEICFSPSCSIQSPQALCPGDSGGPAVHASGIVGVNIITFHCLPVKNTFLRRQRDWRNYEIGLATPVSPYLDWITSVMKTKKSMHSGT